VTKANPGLWTHKYERFGRRSLIESVIGIIRHSSSTGAGYGTRGKMRIL